MLTRIFPISLLAASCLWAQEPATAPQFVDRGMSLLKTGDYANAAIAFQSALDLDSKNATALRGMATSTFRQLTPSQDPIDRNRVLDEAARWNHKLLELSPKDADAYYSLGVIAWTKVYPELKIARGRIGMGVDDPGPLKASVREEMRARFQPTIDAGIQDLNKSLDINPNYADSMAYLNLLFRSRADIADSAEQASTDYRAADEWVKKSMQAKMTLQSSGAGYPFNLAPPPPPPPPPPTPSMPGSIRVSGNVAAANLIRKVDPIYPPLALQARVQGTVCFNITIGKDGSVVNLTLLSGHPLLVGAAQQAVSQWAYKPTLFNGQPVPVITTAEVNFSLNQ